MNERGQSTVEIVAVAPIVLLCCLIGLQALVAGAVHVTAANAAHAGALAGELGHNPAGAARAAVSRWPAGRVDVTAAHGRVRVRMRPRTIVPGLAATMTATAEARFTRP